VTIDFDQFLAVDMRVGRIVAVDEFPEARKPAWTLTIDFGPDIGVKRSSAQIILLRPDADVPLGSRIH
jgi:tRNA-binding protein